MRKNISLKSTLRQPIRTVVMVLLCAAVSFGFLSQVLQYTVMDRAVEEIGGYYRSIGKFYWIDGVESQMSADVSGCVETIRESPMVALIDQQRLTSYTMDKGWTPASVGGLANGCDISQLYVTGNCGWTQIDQGPFDGISTFMQYTDMNLTASLERTYEYRLTGYLSDCRLYCGLPDRLQEGGMSFYYYSDSLEELETIADQMKEKEHVLVKLVDYEQPYYRTHHFFLIPMDRLQAYKSMEVGDTAPEPVLSEQTLPLYFWDLPQEGEVKVSDLPRYVQEDLALLDVNLRSGMLIATKDMTGIAYLTDDYALTEGRMLNRADDLTENPVCVVRQEMMKANNLQLGDTLTLDLWELEDPFAWIRPDLEGKTLEQMEKTRKTFTIVGVLTCLDELDQGMNMAEYRTTVYIPECFLPDGYSPLDGWYSDYYTCIQLRSAADEQAFQAEFGPVLAEDGWRVDFVPTGWQNFKETAGPLRQSAGTSAMIFGGLTCVTLLLVSVVYTRFRRKELALQLAFGVPRKRAAAQAVIPALLLGVLGIGGAAVGAYFHGMEKTVKILGQLAANEPMTVSYEPWKMVLWAAGLLLFQLAAVLLLVGRTVRRPVLEQLRGKRNS